MEQMKILVTGGTGMLGRAIVNSFSTANASHEIVAPTHSELDLQDISELDTFMSELNFEAVIHCAAKVGGIQANIDSPFEFLNSNLRIDSNLINISLRREIPNFIYISSSSIYPLSAPQPYLEDTYFSGALEKSIEGYALAKVVGTKSVEAIGKYLNWRTLILSNLYGPGDSYLESKSHLIPSIINKVYAAKRSDRKEIEMWGDGTSRRELTFVHDVASYICEIIEELNLLPQNMNIGAGIDYSIKDYYEMICQEFEFEGKIVENTHLPTGQKRKIMDSSLARQNGWFPKTDIRLGIKETIKDYIDRKSD